MWLDNLAPLSERTHEVRPDTPGCAGPAGDTPWCYIPSGPGGDGLSRGRAQAKTSTATTAATIRPINPSSKVSKSVARSSDPDTISAILPGRCPARAAWTARTTAVAGAATNSRTPSSPTVTGPTPLASPSPLRNAGADDEQVVVLPPAQGRQSSRGGKDDGDGPVEPAPGPDVLRASLAR